MGNCVQGFISCMKFNSKDHLDIQLINIDSKTSTLDHSFKEISTDDRNKSQNTYMSKTQRVDSQNEGAVSNDDMRDSPKPESDIVGEKNTQITEVGTNLIQTVNQYIKVEIHNPSANALIIGNDNKVNVTKKETDRQPLVDDIKVGNKDNKYIGETMNEILLGQEIDKTRDEFKSRVGGNVTETICKGSEMRWRSRSVSILRQKPFRDFSKEPSFTVDPRTMLRNFQWNQYAMIQETLLRTVSCEIMKCESPETLSLKIKEINAELQTIVDKYNEKLRKSVLKTGHANERIISGLNEKSKIVLNNANDKLLQLKKERIQDFHIIPWSTTHEIGTASERDKMTSYAKDFKCLISKKVCWHVSTLMPFKIQQFIITFTFDCQKSFVLKQMMIEFDSTDVSNIIKFIFDPNEFAKKWLVSFTDQKIFVKKSPNKLHVYAKIAKMEVEKIFDELKLAIIITSTKHRKGEINDLSDWAKCFLQNLKSLPLSSKDLGEFQSLRNDFVKEFIDIVASNLESMKSEIIANFKNTTANDVKWRVDPYNYIIECLWGCIECCPFCHEPCQYSDIEHITHENKHKCIQHRPLVAYGSIKDDSNTIMLENCNSLIRSPDRSFKLINEDNPPKCSNNNQPLINWEILPAVVAGEFKYWKWLICNRKDELRQFFRTSANIIPKEWNSITEEDAIRSLDEIYICS
ncbi:Hypothetical predicted protein [Mytilus galloprovincialis]|uniref:Uncharacterized protein n=1 Tax=Mytilus galloprovincialis TaxID=29158 RepID=A0A8B6GD25_MYTGA|nr:Hypothetical predicted protein [Mytilus galloprovincialis]